MKGPKAWGWFGMQMQMEPPEKSEGFDRIFVVDENGDIKEEF